MLTVTYVIVDIRGETSVNCTFDDEDWCGYVDLYTDMADWHRAQEDPMANSRQ